MTHIKVGGGGGDRRRWGKGENMRADNLGESSFKFFLLFLKKIFH